MSYAKSRLAVHNDLQAVAQQTRMPALSYRLADYFTIGKAAREIKISDSFIKLMFPEESIFESVWKSKNFHGEGLAVMSHKIQMVLMNVSRGEDYLKLYSRIFYGSNSNQNIDQSDIGKAGLLKASSMI